MIKKKAYAKINLSLDVKGKLENGYHEVCMIMQTIGLYDELSFDVYRIDTDTSRASGEKSEGEKASEEDRIRLSCSFVWSDIEPTDDPKDNLAYKAAKLLLPYFPEGTGVDIKIVKNIPMAAGMAGGSSDAAATLRGINELFKIGLSDEKLCELGVKIGADVPYCILGGTMLAEGIGEKLTRLPAIPKLYLVIAKPQAGVSTKYVYQTLDALENPPHPDVEAMQELIVETSKKGARSKEAEPSKEACIDGGRLSGADDVSASFAKNISPLLGNILESVTIPVCPKVAEIKKILLDNGALGSLMSGSGPTVFGIFESEEKANLAAKVLIDMCTAAVSAVKDKSDTGAIEEAFEKVPAKDIFVSTTVNPI
ncbi:MAG: 4-(cytidine 5'-diphospho)-2-C-methyl-D-erythritol kinase [Lachnospiraceae bacterium]|nr:4-(cytidine 5'-diphospho)-2-C-methyl-D-erythritol kinase [Lachnospiraceae bacterium]